MQQLTLHIHGQVQGVGFRWTVEGHAEAHRLVGTVQNLKDGSVKVVVQGPKSALESFFKALKESPGQATITAAEASFAPVQEPHTTFRIIH